MSDDATPQEQQDPDGGLPDEVDPVISDAVHGVSNRFGAPGLEQLITLARAELERAREALDELGS